MTKMTEMTEITRPSPPGATGAQDSGVATKPGGTQLRWHPRAVAMGLPWFLCLLLPWREEEEAGNRGMMPGATGTSPRPCTKELGGVSGFPFLPFLKVPSQGIQVSYGQPGVKGILGKGSGVAPSSVGLGEPITVVPR